MILTSSVFKDNRKIPSRYTGEGQNVSPPLEWSYVPNQCKELILFCEDPDAPKSPNQDHPFIHWVLYNIPASISALPEGLDAQPRLTLPVPVDQGENSFGKIGYSGPMPPAGDDPHHYHFTLYALNVELGLSPGITKQDLQKAMKGHVISKAELVGIFERQASQRKKYEQEKEAKINSEKKSPYSDLSRHQ